MRRPARDRDEAGLTTVVWLVLAIPLLVGLIGMAVDFFRVYELKATLEARAKLALSQAANEWAITTSGDAGFDVPIVQAVAVDGYDRLTANLRRDASDTAGPTLTCLSPELAGASGYCQVEVTVQAPFSAAGEYTTGFCSDASAELSPTVALSTVEAIPTSFLHVVGIPEMEVPIDASVAVRAGNC